MMQSHPEMIQVIENNEQELQEIMHGHAQSIMNNVVYTIPVVFHVIHLGEAVGSGSNISNAQLLQGLQDLNDDFRNTSGLGNDVEIEFCLAQRDPSGNVSTGINRVNGSAVPGYAANGMTMGLNEAQLKGLSIWPNTDYLNIWVVHNIVGGGSGTILGFATFPGTAPSLDGITMRFNAVGIGNASHVLAHEAGHFFNLYHTFQGGSTTVCPPNANCNDDGDKVCDTPPHLLVYGGCNTTGLNSCDNNSSLALVAHNHMNYTDNSCRYEFTDEQVMRARGALMMLRPSLMNSLGCSPGCTTTIANFTSPANNEITVGTTYTFDNTSTSNGAPTWSWTIDGVEIATTEDLTHTFNAGGIFEICLTAYGPNCVNQKCIVLTVRPICQPPSDPCENVINGDFEQITGPATNVNDFTPVCGWKKTASTPFYCNGPTNNAIGLFLNSGDLERITSKDPLALVKGKTCTISFDYLVTNESPASILVALTANNNLGPLPASANIIAEVFSPGVDYVEDNNNNQCYNTNYSFHTYSGTFTYNGDGQLYLNVTGTADGQNAYPWSIVFIDNISINCCGTSTGCDPAPDFTYTLEKCSATFTGTNTGDPGPYVWDFGDGTTATGQVVTHEYIYGGTFTVCVTVACDLETSKTVCKQITIPETCNQCLALDPVPAVICDVLPNKPNTWLANFCFDVPNGYKGCLPDKLFVGSNEVIVIVKSFTIDESNPLTDRICVALELIPPPNYNFIANGAVGHITLCKDGSPMICREFQIVASECENCIAPVNAEAVCNDPNPNDQVYVYTGTISVTMPAGLAFCGVNSSAAGFTVLNAVESPVGSGNWTISFRFTTTLHNFMFANALLCFRNPTNETRYCVPVNIRVYPCDLPTDCVANWSPKNMTCTSVNSQYVIFNIVKSVYGGGYQICPGGLFGTIDGGGSVQDNGSTIVNGVFNININIRIPVGVFVSGQLYNMRLYICNEEGDVVCYFFPMYLSCTTVPGGGGGGGIGGGHFGGNSVEERNLTITELAANYSIMPNPATDQLVVVTDNFDEERTREVVLTDMTGRIVHRTTLTFGKQAINITDQYPGVYVVTIIENGVPVKMQKVVIMR